MGSKQIARDPYLVAQTSRRNRVVRAIWGIAYALVFRPTLRTSHGWRCFVLRCFGARIGVHGRIYRKCEIWAPWNLVCEDVVTIADGAVIYNPSLVTIASHATVSQDAYLCGAGHDIDSGGFAMVSKPITLGAYSWICARAVVMPGVTVCEGAVLALGAIASRDLEPWSVYAGAPARLLRRRSRPLDERAPPLNITAA